MKECRIYRIRIVIGISNPLHYRVRFDSVSYAKRKLNSLNINCKILLKHIILELWIRRQFYKLPFPIPNVHFLAKNVTFLEADIFA